jgi:hypothetical protein
MIHDILALLALEEALAGVIDVKHLNFWPNANHAGADAEAKLAPRHRKL